MFKIVILTMVLGVTLGTGMAVYEQGNALLNDEELSSVMVGDGLCQKCDHVDCPTVGCYAEMYGSLPGEDPVPTGKCISKNDKFMRADYRCPVGAAGDKCYRGDFGACVVIETCDLKDTSGIGPGCTPDPEIGMGPECWTYAVENCSTETVSAYDNCRSSGPYPDPD